jgi:hypothetical protein
LLLDGCCNLQQKKPFATFGARFDYCYERVCLIWSHATRKIDG